MNQLTHLCCKDLSVFKSFKAECNKEYKCFIAKESYSFIIKMTRKLLRQSQTFVFIFGSQLPSTVSIFQGYVYWCKLDSFIVLKLRCENVPIFIPLAFLSLLAWAHHSPAFMHSVGTHVKYSCKRKNCKSTVQHPCYLR
jgi:hypothetical protein